MKNNSIWKNEKPIKINFAAAKLIKSDLYKTHNFLVKNETENILFSSTTKNELLEILKLNDFDPKNFILFNISKGLDIKIELNYSDCLNSKQKKEFDNLIDFNNFLKKDNIKAISAFFKYGN